MNQGDEKDRLELAPRRSVSLATHTGLEPDAARDIASAMNGTGRRFRALCEDQER